jgi:hypothetical protein
MKRTTKKHLGMTTAVAKGSFAANFGRNFAC